MVSEIFIFESVNRRTDVSMGGRMRARVRSYKLALWEGRRAGLELGSRTPERRGFGSSLVSPCYVLEQDTITSQSTGNTQEVVASSQHDWKIVYWDFKKQINQNHLVSLRLSWAKKL